MGPTIFCQNLKAKGQTVVEILTDYQFLVYRLSSNLIIDSLEKNQKKTKYFI